MARIVTFTNQKGGVAKSTTCEAFAAELVARGNKVLLVDMDAQPGNMSLHVGADKSQPGVYELLYARKVDRALVQSCIQPTEGFGDIIVGDERLDELDEKLQARVGRERVLQKALLPIKNEYDYVLIDTPPALQVRTIAAISAADEIIIPMLPDVSALSGMDSIVSKIQEVQEAVDHPIRVAGVLVCAYDGRQVLARQVNDLLITICSQWDIPVFQTHIRKAVVLQQAQRFGKSITAYKKDSAAARDYSEAVSEFLTCIYK